MEKSKCSFFQVREGRSLEGVFGERSFVAIGLGAELAGLENMRNCLFEEMFSFLSFFVVWLGEQ